MNRVKCLQCGRILTSTYRHDFQQCDCPNETFIDGGDDYQRYGGVELKLVEILDSPGKKEMCL